MSSPKQSNLPERIPLNATNSWVLDHARPLLDYERGTVEQWLSEVTDDEYDELTTGKLSTHVEARPKSLGHPAGSLSDYNPDCAILSQKTIEMLEASVAEEFSDEEGSFFTSLDRCSESDSDMSSSLFFDCGSVLNRNQNLGTSADGVSELDSGHDSAPTGRPDDFADLEETWNCSLISSPVSTQASEIDSGSEAESSRGRSRCRSRRNTLVSPVCPPSQSPRYSADDCSTRCPSPLPSMRSHDARPIPTVPWGSTLDSIPEMFIPERGYHVLPSPARPGVWFSSVRRKILAPEIVRPIPQRAECLGVPSPSRTHFHSSPFMDQGSMVACEVPTLVFEEVCADEPKGKNAEGK
ncbi:hypothetical protein F5Y19DRAFT_177403 [Xylariaceae sp. FL1651]|nr:hypothetical protein F5Y19DRAFT_177403 [Xylariaceae sp. FL1651]